jgi:hypothetical protein
VLTPLIDLNDGLLDLDDLNASIAASLALLVSFSASVQDLVDEVSVSAALLAELFSGELADVDFRRLSLSLTLALEEVIGEVLDSTVSLAFANSVQDSVDVETTGTTLPNSLTLGELVCDAFDTPRRLALRLTSQVTDQRIHIEPTGVAFSSSLTIAQSIDERVSVNTAGLDVADVECFVEV